MALVKWNRDDRFPVFSRFFEDFFNDEPFFPSSWMNRVPAVNILENKDSFSVELAAPGLNKNDFKINLENNLLTIECSKEDKKEEKDERFTRREFCYSSFQRSFTLPNTIDTNKIDAKYEDGVLKINLPKKEEAKEKPARQISIK
ncbi:MAG TPA: Hsp20/alpha crystallin family protein [Bacteroidia bacterium]|nr:Hsp20/alpha crystallin family protein [Sphingobacteriales bacterium]HPD65082.1 Hsp20/alpha crystallin family protein [Bacteroidia bacterium]HRS58757.1 Hsp20/alpha crystallin family protein [Bacteroidia bacterium]HRU67909.1 Hsp20/alpha crystallin family protein [Bacteroidia bacterium]